jgi:hypothetical protein
VEVGVLLGDCRKEDGYGNPTGRYITLKSPLYLPATIVFARCWSPAAAAAGWATSCSQLCLPVTDSWRTWQAHTC